ncbi:MAG TPA: bifunctional glycosyltransferase/class I SAM-dependent methyltransferase [Terriglobales bacterium]|nr:bifunctional glycosyltransferase/class I SAM-dependent methyltransferase [Terriglobales bacterium]
MSTTLSVLVPVYNEQYLVAASLRRLAVLGQSPLLERIQVIVVDDCSRDDTPSILAELQRELSASPWPKFDWLFLRHERNQGKGAAIRTAIEHVACELAVIHDADLEYHPRDLLHMVPLFADESADAVFGSRFLAGGFKRALFFRHSLGNHLLTFLCDLASDLNLTDIETCYKMVRADLLKTIPLVRRDFRIEPELTLKLAKRGARIFEVPISYSGRTYQEGKKIGWKDGVKALGAILRFRLSDRICKPDAYGSDLVPRLARAPHLTDWIADSVRPHVGRRVLEIGAGVGNLTLRLIPRQSYWTSDPNPMFVRELEKLQATRPYLRASCVDPVVPATFPAETFDTIICQNVAEHVEDDAATLRSLSALLEDGGRLIVLTPQGRNLYGSLDRVLGHLRRYRRHDLRELAERTGLRVQWIEGINRAGTPAWWLNARLLRRRSFGLLQIKLFNALVPLLRSLQWLLPFPPMTLVAVLEKAPAGAQADTAVAQTARAGN